MPMSSKHLSSETVKYSIMKLSLICSCNIVKLGIVHLIYDERLTKRDIINYSQMQ